MRTVTTNSGGLRDPLQEQHLYCYGTTAAEQQQHSSSTAATQQPLFRESNGPLM
jgi:hypothetical protein